MKRRIALVITLCFCFVFAVTEGQERHEPAADSTGQTITEKPQPVLYFDIPVLDFPFQQLAIQTSANHRNALGADGRAKPNAGDFFRSYANPGMNQSLNWSASWLTLVGAGINKGADAIIKPGKPYRKAVKRLIGELAFTGSNVILIYFPLADGWVHEEFHRAGMTTNTVYSYDNINSFRVFGAGRVSVSRESDSDLALFKKNDFAGFNRMLVAGGEGELLLTRKLYLNNFYNGTKLPLTLYSILIKKLVTAYPNNDADTAGHAELAARKLAEPQISDRDFTGPDYSGWAWHIFKPRVPYDSLGVHPGGVGIDRYKAAPDLTAQELAYLKKAGRLMYLNFISPMTVGINRVPLGHGRQANFAVQTFINGFGYDINPEIYYTSDRYSLYFGVHNYHNYENAFWGIEFGSYKNALSILGKPLIYDGRVMLWTQPKNQEFMTARASFGGLIQTTVYYPLNKWLNGNVDIEAKTNGWAAGNPFLKSNVSVRTGITLAIKQSPRHS